MNPTEDHLNRVAKYMTHRTASLKRELFPSSEGSDKVLSAYSIHNLDKKFEVNVQCQMEAIAKVSLLDIPPEERPKRELHNPFTRVKASPENSSDLLNFRKIGEEKFRLRISYYILREPSVQAPIRRKALRTFTTKTVKSKKVSKLERDQKLLLSALKKKLQYSQKSGKPVQNPGEQLLEFPLSICDNEGMPIKGTKSNITKILERRYSTLTPPIITSHLHNDWAPECAIVEGMFMINTLPLPSHTTLRDYANFLLRRHAISQFKNGCREVHVLFDNPGRLENTPKHFEKSRRDALATVPTSHKCGLLTEGTAIEHRHWRANHLNCRSCKRKLVVFLGHYFLHNASTYLRQGQKLFCCRSL